jgi:hypothetical protein
MPLPISVSETYSQTRTATAYNGAAVAMFGTPITVFVPSPKLEPDPITNVWHDDFADEGLWVLGGVPWASPAISGYVQPSSWMGSIKVTGQYDIANKRINVSILASQCTSGPPCAAWDYVGIFSCWRPGNSECNGFDPCNDTFDSPLLTTGAWLSNYARVLVLFPVGAPDPQGVLEFGNCK